MTQQTAFQTALNNLLKEKNSSKKNLFDTIYVWQNYSGINAVIIDAVAALGEGFVVDICNKAAEALTYDKEGYLTEKQAWCIVYAFTKISDEALTAWYEAYVSEAEAEENESSVEAEVAEEQTIEENEVEPTVKVKEIRIWNYNANHQWLNVHYKDGSQKSCRITPSRMRPVYKALREKKDDNAVLCEIIADIPHESWNQPRKQMTALEERMWELNHYRQLGILYGDQEKEYRTLLSNPAV